MGKSLVIKGADFSLVAVNEATNAVWGIGEWGCTSNQFGQVVTPNTSVTNKRYTDYIDINYSIVVCSNVSPKFIVYFFDAGKKLIGFYNQSGIYSDWVTISPADMLSKAPEGTKYYTLEIATATTSTSEYTFMSR